MSDNHEKIESPIEGLCIAETKYGLGVFATDTFEVEDLVGRVEGKIFDDPDYGGDYCMDLGGNLTMEPGPPFRFLNHCCTPNCQIVHFEEENELWIEVVRDIEPGEQLTIDYSWPASDAIPCECDSPECRGWIVDADEVDLIEE